jgi:hypothetical protein
VSFLVSGASRVRAINALKTVQSNGCESTRLLFLIAAGLFLTESSPSQAAAVVGANPPGTNSFDAKVTALGNQLPPPQTHYADVSEADAAGRLRREQEYQTFVREKLQGQWFAALTAAGPDESYSIQGRFKTWKGLMDFLLERDALVEVWAYPEAGQKPRRIPATEVASLKK